KACRWESGGHFQVTLSYYIIARTGTQFDPGVVEAFQRVMTNWLVDVSIRWTPDMSVGNSALDEDHRRLIKLINQLATADARGDRSVIESVLDELIHYTDFHFSREEEHMLRVGFPQYLPHKEKHEHLLRQVHVLRKRFFNGLPGRLSDEIIEFLSRWLTTHIQTHDQQYRSFLEEHGHNLN
ncbi:MAG: bacteriohemerythrin, partial [Rhodospirillaceae bacterium]